MNEIRQGLRCVHVVPAVDHEASGPSYSVVRLCEALSKSSEIEVTLATLDERRADAPRFMRRFIPGFGPARLGNSPDMRRWLYALHGKVDVIHNHSLWMMPNVYAGNAAAKACAALVVSPRGTLSPWAFASGSVAKRLFWPLLQRPAIRNAACFHATSAEEARNIRSAGFRQPIVVIPNGIDIPIHEDVARKPRRTLLYLGRLHPIKGLDRLLHAWENVQRDHPDWDLEIVGPHEQGYREGLEALARTLGAQRVTFSGPRWGVEKFRAYSSADLYVLPSHSENFGVSVAEALACATPAVVTQGAPWQGIVSAGAGWWAESSVEGITRALREALSRDRGELEEMGRKGREWMRSEYSWNRIGGLMLETYRWIIHGGQKPQCLFVE